jgi:predicted transcriptional regulator of viral defense system
MCYVLGEMRRGRPNIAERLVLDYAAAKSDPVIDVTVDRPALERLGIEAGLSKMSVPDALKRLKQKNYAHRLQNGRYLIRSEPTRSARLWSLDPVAEAIFKRLKHDYYVSWHAALWHYGLIDQQSRLVSVAVRRRPRPVQFGAGTVRFVLVSERKFFGYHEVTDLEWPVQMATVSKALLDSFDRPDLVGPAPVVVEALRRACREDASLPEQIVKDALRVGSPTLNRRLGFFLDLLEIPGGDALLPYAGKSSAEPLFPGREPRRKTEIDPKWRVYLDPGLIGTALELK